MDFDKKRALDAYDLLESRGYRFFRSRKFYTPKSGHDILPDEQEAINIVLEVHPGTYELVN